MCNKEQISHNEFLEDVKDLLRRSIAAKLDINQVLLLGNFSAQQTVEEKLTVIMAIGYNENHNAAISDLLESGFMYDGREQTRKTIGKVVSGCLISFNHEIAAFSRMNELLKNGMDVSLIWGMISEGLSLTGEYEYEFMRKMNMKYKNGPA